VGNGCATVPKHRVRVIMAASFRPARRERLATRLATHIAAQREVRIVTPSWSGHFVATVEDSLDAEEDPFADERFEVAAPRHAKVWHVDLADVNAVPQ
jgi:hypothetical protein